VLVGLGEGQGGGQPPAGPAEASILLQLFTPSDNDGSTGSSLTSNSADGSSIGWTGSGTSPPPVLLAQLAVPVRWEVGNLPAGSSPDQAIPITGSSEELHFVHDGTLALPWPVPEAPPADPSAPGPAQAPPLPPTAAPIILPGQPLEGLAAALGLPPGAVQFFNLTNSQTVGLDVAACSPQAALQVVVFARGYAAW